MPTSDLERLARDAFEEVWSAGRVGAVERFFAPAEAARAARHAAALRAAFPDYSTSLEAVTVTGDTAVLRWTFRGSHSGRFAGLAPTGRAVSVACVSIYRFTGGVVVERTSLWEMLNLLDQLQATG